MVNLVIIGLYIGKTLHVHNKNSKPSRRLFSISQTLLEGITVIMQKLTGDQVAPSNGTTTGHLMGLQLNPMRLPLDVKIGLRLSQGHRQDLLRQYHQSPTPPSVPFPPLPSHLPDSLPYPSMFSLFLSCP